MTEQTLKALIDQGEGQALEFKLRPSEDIGRTICAFANTGDGTILVGISDSKELVGTSPKMESQIASIAHSCRPSVFPKIEAVEIEGRDILVVRIKKTGSIHSYKNIAYKRVGSHDQPLSPQEVIELARETGRIRFEDQICERASLEDIDEEKLQWYLTKRRTSRRKPPSEELDSAALLINLGAVRRYGHKLIPTNAGILFFGRNPQSFIPQSRLLAVRFEGRELSRTTIDDLDCQGTIWEIVEQTEEFIRRNIRLFGFRTRFAFRRIDKMEYPVDALREAIINALIHRDYFETSDTKVFIFDDRIEILNPGSFPEGVSPERPIHKPRNPLLCQFMRDIGLIEKYGSGIYFMKDMCKDWGISEPEFILSQGQTKVVFKSAGKGILIQELRRLGIEFNQRQIKGLEYLLLYGKLSTKIYCQLNQVVPDTANRDLNDLLEKGIIKRLGKGRTAHYVPNIG